jgi:membrane protease YdiL (CAAX protease family)
MEENSLFYGPDGLRSGWRVALFVLLSAALLSLAGVAASLILFHTLTPKIREFTPSMLIVLTAFHVLAVVVALLIMARIERVPFSTYGLPPADAFRGKFWGGIVLGFVALSALLLCIRAFHGFDLGNAPDPPATEAKYGALYALGFLLVGFFEELLLRSYLLYRLARSKGFWFGAVISSIIFALLHLGNSGEAKIGILAVFCAGMLFSFFIRRTGNLWFAIGFHASWDWAQSYFYGVPDSGTTATGNLFHSHLSGPKWLTGGSVGPEGSYLAFVILAACAIVVHLLYPKAQYPSAGSFEPQLSTQVTNTTNLSDAEEVT